MNPFFENQLNITRREFFGKSAASLGTAALASIMGNSTLYAGDKVGQWPQSCHHRPKAKRVIYLMMSGAPSHVDLFDHKPDLTKDAGKEIPDEIRMGQRVTTMSKGQKSFALMPELVPFKRYGKNGRMMSELLPHIGSISDDLCLVKSMYTESINHAPAMTFFLTGSELAGRPSTGAWVNYGLGSLNENLPSFIVLTSRDKENSCGQLFFDYYWGSGFVPSKYQGVQLRGQGDPVLYLSDPKGMGRAQKKRLIDSINHMNHLAHEEYADPEILTRIAQYEMAYKMQTSVPELIDFSDEPKHVLEMYGPDVHRPGSFARNCLHARRMAERGVRFIQLMHAGWDQHRNIGTQLEIQCKDTDQPSAALVKDLKQRGLLEDTLVIWGGEFGRTPFRQTNPDPKKWGRDHHGNAFSVWMAGGGVKPGFDWGHTDRYGYNVADAEGNFLGATKHKYTRGAVHIHDFQATVLDLLGLDHTRLSFKYQGRSFRLTDVHGHSVKDIIA